MARLPIVLLADSQLLFWNDGDELFLDRARRWLDADSPRAAYLGASNGDRPEFYELFRAAMEGVGIDDCRMIPFDPASEDFEFFERADLILLAGGDVERGWKTFEANGLRQKIVDRYLSGALLIGISAGAIQIGLHGFGADNLPADGGANRFDTFQLVPLAVDVHDEPQWDRLTAAMPWVDPHVQGVGIPSGSGAVIHPDMTVEPVRRALVEMSCKNGEVRRHLILPPAPDSPGSDSPPG